MEHLDSGEVLVDDVGDSDLSGTMSEDLFWDQTGDVAITISSEGGADCDRNYLLTIELSE